MMTVRWKVNEFFCTTFENETNCKLKILKNIGKFGDTVWAFFEIDLKWSSEMVKKLLRGVYLR